MTAYIYKFNLFGKEAYVTIFDADPLIAKDIAYKAYQEALRLHKFFNYYDSCSELSLLNKKRKLRMSKEVIYLIKKSQNISAITEGRYDITFGKAIDAAKCGKKIEVKCSYKDVCINGEIVTLEHSEAKIDLGSIAKGYIVDKMVDAIKSEGIISGIVDARGDIRIFGRYVQEVHIQHPRKQDQIIEKIYLKNQAVATSGDYSQYTKSYDLSHIFKKGGFISVTVVASSLMEADLFATALIVSSPGKARAILNKNKDLKAMAIDDKLNIYRYNGFQSLRKK